MVKSTVHWLGGGGLQGWWTGQEERSLLCFVNVRLLFNYIFWPDILTGEATAIQHIAEVVFWYIALFILANFSLLQIKLSQQKSNMVFVCAFASGPVEAYHLDTH